MEAAAMPSNGTAICAALVAPIRAWTKRKAGEWARFGRRNPVVRTMIVHWIIGVGTGLFCAGLLLGLDPLGFRSLLFRSDALVAGLVLLFGGFAITFGGAVCAAAVMFPDFDGPDRHTGRRRAPHFCAAATADPSAQTDRRKKAGPFLSASS
jgi:hypothetical protein